MATHSAQCSRIQSPSHLLLLPLEIRRLIYYELLVSTRTGESPARPYVTWHDRDNRHRPARRRFVNPQILAVNKQIHAEATPILYECNAIRIDIHSPVISQCSGGMYADSRMGGSPPRYLFRSDTVGHSTPPYFDADIPGLIYPHCFAWIREIEIYLSAYAIWGSSVRGRPGGFFSHIGKLLVEVLRLFAAETEDNTEMTHEKDVDLRRKRERLLMTVHGRERALFARRRKQERDLEKRNEAEEEAWSEDDERHFNEQGEMADQILLLVEAVSKKREVEIVEVETVVTMG
ncbi:MAG: hypothetical protein Q9213_000814 [Squamulea squamosa]